MGYEDPAIIGMHLPEKLDVFHNCRSLDFDLTAFVNRGWAVRSNEAVGRYAACINFSLATGSVSMKVCIGVLP
jgi:hypothetical protein